MPSRRSRCSGATTSPATPCSASAAPAVSTPAGWPTRSAWSASSSTRWPGCSPPTAWAWPTSAPCARPRSTGRSPGRRSRPGCGRPPSRSAGRPRPRWQASARPATRSKCWSRRICATRAPTPPCRSMLATGRGHAYGLRGGPPGPVRLRARGPAAGGGDRSWSRPSAAPTPRQDPETAAPPGATARRRHGPPVERGRLAARRRSTGASSCTPGQHLPGPALIIEPIATVVVEPGWQATVNSRNHLVLSRYRTPAGRRGRRPPGRSGACSRSSTICSCPLPSRWG